MSIEQMIDELNDLVNTADDATAASLVELLTELENS